GQSVIQSNQQSVIQSANNQLPVLTKGNVILVGKPNSVIQTTQGNLQTLQVVVEAGSDDSLSNDEDATTRKRRDILTRRPSYRKILNDLGGAEISGSKTTFFKPLFVLQMVDCFRVQGARWSRQGPTVTLTWTPSSRLILYQHITRQVSVSAF
ncbi:Cyclic AMP-responsive element-binding protein 1, partial [Homalodisca vitripennis]